MAYRNRLFLVLWFLLALLLVGCASQATSTPAPVATRDPNLEKAVEQQLGAIDPAAVEIYRQATVALDAGDYNTSRQLYQQVQKLAPGFATVYRRLGYIEMNVKNLEGAEQLARKALELEPDGYNENALAQVLLQKDTPKDAQDAFNHASAAAKLLPEDEDINMVLTWAALKVNDTETARLANERVLKINPSNSTAHYFAGILAANTNQWEQAEAELLLSRDLGMPADAVQQTLDSGVSRMAFFYRLLRGLVIALMVWLLGLGALYLAGSMLSRATLRAISAAQPGPEMQIQPEERRIRAIYRAVVTVLSLYFYISIPFVILLLLLVVGGVFYLILLLGVIPIQLSIVLVLVLVVSLFALVRALFFSRIRDVSPGHALQRKDAPALWKLIDEVAAQLKIRPVDMIHVTPGVEVAVNERGGILRKLRGAGRRNLLLGMGVLPGLTQAQFAAILAHEYGHFSNQDTAGGDLAHQVYASLDQLAKQLVRGGAAQIFNPVWLFVMGYQRIYLRVTQGASRLQEVLADRYAARAFGSRNFIDGLRGLVRRAQEFELGANLELKRSFELKQPVLNLYNLPLQQELLGELDKQVEELMQRKTGMYDSHPALAERIELVERMQYPHSAGPDDLRPALELFPDPEGLQKEMTKRVIQSINKG